MLFDHRRVGWILVLILMQIAIKFNTWDVSHDLKNVILQSNKGVFTFIKHTLYFYDDYQYTYEYSIQCSGPGMYQSAMNGLIWL